MRRTISGMIGAGSLAHNRRDFIAENVDPDRVHLNICYQNENLKEVYKELFDDSVKRYNVGKRKDRQITNYYEKIRQGKQEKLFHEVIFQIGNREDMAVGTTEGDLAVKVLDEYVKNFQQRNPTLHVFNCYLHQDEATPHLHIDFVPYVTGWKGKGMDTRVSLKQALKSLGFQGGNKHDTELNQWINHEKELLAEIARQHGIEWEQKGTHEEHLDVYNFKKKELFEKIANDLGLCDKLMIIKQTLKNVEKSIEINDWLYNEDELHLHLAAVCCDFKNKRVFIAKRSTARGKYSACWEFGCAKANKSQGYIECIKKEYEDDFGLKIKIMVSSDRGEQCPTPYALYEINENSEDFQSDKGIIVYAKIMNDNIDEFANKKDYKKHECSLLLTEEAARKFLSENEESVPDFKDTIMHAFAIMKKDEEDYQWR